MDFQFHLWPQDRYADLEQIGDVVVAAEDLGYKAVASGEHILVPNGPESEVIGSSYYDPMVLFSHLAQRTSKIELQFCTLVVPYRHPALAARGIASIDQASAGRFVVVVGSGWAPGEFAALGIPFDQRGAMTDEYIAAMRDLWTQESASFDGVFVKFAESSLEPKCVQTPHVALWVGGGGAVARRRMREFGSGWLPMTASTDVLATEIAAMREDVAAAGRDPDALEFSYHLTYKEADPYHGTASKSVTHAIPVDPLARTADEAAEMIAAYAALGVTRMDVRVRWDSPEMLIERLQEFAEEVMPLVHGN